MYRVIDLIFQASLSVSFWEFIQDQTILVQVTKPEKRVEAMDSSQSESEEPEAKSGRGRKRKSEDTPASSEKKAKKGKAKKGDNL